jgi:hypothetical protein
LKRIFLLIRENLITKVVTVGGRVGTATWSWLKEKPAVQYSFMLLLASVLLTGSVALFTWMADSERSTQMPEKSGGGTVPQEEVASTVQLGASAREIVESSDTPPVENAGPPSTVIENAVAKANADGTSAQAVCVAGVPPEATAGGGVPEAECTKPALPLPAPTPAPPPPGPAKALPPAGGVDVTSLLGVGTGILLVGGGLLARRFIT